VHCQQAAKLRQRLARHLDRRFRHGAIGIDSESDVVYGLAACCGIGDHHLFIFRPCEIHVKRSLRNGGGSRLLHQLLDLRLQHTSVRRLFIRPIGVEHRLKRVGGGQN